MTGAQLLEPRDAIEAPARRRRGALALLCAAQFMVVLDVTIVAVALPAIQRDLALSPATLTWLVTAYTLAFGGLLIAAGRAADLAGRRRLFALGLGLFSAASLGCGMARSAEVLIAMRCVQGLGAALVAPSALALLTATFADGAERRRAVGAWTAAAAGGGASGWVLGGLLTQSVGWHWVFLVNVPVGIAGMVAAPRVLTASRAAHAGGLDVPGAATVTAALALLVFGLTAAERTGFAAPETLLALAGAAGLLGAFTAIERRVRHPLLPLPVLRSRRLSAATLGALALTGATTPPMLLAVLFQQQVLGYGALRTGLGCAPFNLAVIAGSLAGPRIAAAAGTRATMSGGLVAIAAGALVLTTTAVDTSYAATLLPAFLLMGAGLGCASVASTAAGTAALATERQGLAAGLLNAAAQIGTVLGLAVLMTLAAARTDALDGRDAAATLAGHHSACLGAALLALAAALVTSRLVRGIRG
jgi:EmrB/QacA subfamily drug resistance transporter